MKKLSLLLLVSLAICDVRLFYAGKRKALLSGDYRSLKHRRRALAGWRLWREKQSLERGALAEVLPDLGMAGVNFNAMDKDGLSNLSKELYKHDSEEGEALLKEEASIFVKAGQMIVSSALHKAAECGNKETVLAVLKKEGLKHINLYNSNGRTPLVIAVLRGHKEIVRVLVENGADINSRDTGEWMTALHYAVREGHEEIVQMLVEKGADLNIKDRWGDTPLHNAACYDQEKIAQMLVEKGANLTIKNNAQITPQELLKLRFGPSFREKWLVTDEWKKAPVEICELVAAFLK